MGKDEDKRERRRGRMMTADERDVVGDGFRARPSPFEIPFDVGADVPAEVHAEITDVHELQRRTAERLPGADEQARRVAAAVVAVLAEHQNRGEMRSADLAAMAAAGKSPTATAPAQIWWVKAIRVAIRVVPYVVSVGGVLVAAVLWLNDAARASEREAGDLRARLGQIEFEIKSLRRSQEWLWRRVNPDFAPVFPAMPGDPP